MDTLKGILLPILLALMASSLGYLGSISKEDALAFAAHAQTITARPSNDDSVAPRAQAEARRRAFIKRAHEANIQGTGFYGAAGILLAMGAILFVTHLRPFRGYAPPEPGSQQS